MDQSVEEDLERLLTTDREGPVLTGAAFAAPLSSLQLSAPVVLPESATVRDAIDLMKAQHLGAILIVNGAGQVVGIFTERDLVLRVIDPPRDWRQTPLVDFMTRSPDSLRTSDPIAYAVHRMHLGGYRHVPVVDAVGAPVGLVSTREIVALVAETFAESICNLAPDATHPEPRNREGG